MPGCCSQLDPLRLVAFFANFGFELLEVIEEGSDNVGIKDSPAAFAQHRERFVACHCLSVVPIFAHGVKAIR